MGTSEGAQIISNWERRGRLYWLVLAVPYAIYAAAFWPGLISNDSVDGWREATAGPISRAHSPFYNFICRFLITLWHSPGAIVVFQILVGLFAVSWALREVVALGGSRKLAWFSLAMFSIFPASAVVTISILPDHLYSVAILVFTVLLFRALATGATSITRASIIVAAVLIALLRPNGPPVPMATLAVIAVFSAPLRRSAAAALVLSLMIFVFVDRPVFGLLGVQPGAGSAGIMNPIILQTAAHTAAGTPTEEADAAFLSKVYPTTPWPYECGNAMTTSFAPNFNGAPFVEDRRAALTTWWHLTSKAPMVNIRHQFCLDAFVWDVRQTPSFLFAASFSDHVLQTQNFDHVPTWVEAPNETGWRLPWRNIERVLSRTTRAPLFSIAWASGPYLYLLLAVTLVCAFRLKRRQLVFAALPVLVNTAAIAFFTGSSEYRYLHSTMVVALALLPAVAMRSEKK